jgi:hypothetical protein
MKRLLLSLITLLVAGGVATGVLRSHLLFRHGAMPSIQEQQSAESARQLPAQDFEDRSLVFPREPTR